MEDDGGWDLQAVVRGCRGSARSTAEAAAEAAAAAAADPLLFLPLVTKREKEEEEDLFGCLSEVFPTQTEGVHDLKDLCKPFFTKSFEQNQQMHQLSPKERPSYLLPQQQIRHPEALPFSQTPRAKRRKNQQKKVVRQVPAGGHSSDMWAWRKYGQKPIKGSPYPRGYYRCSSSKGCLARKQVERSRTDPDTLVVTYTGEHNHPVPTHRNSLAGSTRQKFPSSSSSAGSSHGSNPELTTSQAMSAELSPTTPLTSSMDDELPFTPRRKTDAEEVEEEEEVDDDDDDEEGNLLLLGDMEILRDDDLLFTDFPNGFPHRIGAPPIQWMPSGATTASGGGG